MVLSIIAFEYTLQKHIYQALLLKKQLLESNDLTLYVINVHLVYITHDKAVLAHVSWTLKGRGNNIFDIIRHIVLFAVKSQEFWREQCYLWPSFLLY